jgi:hypothetical protein
MRDAPQGIDLPNALQLWFDALSQAVSELEVPSYPHPVFTIAVAGLPPAAKYQNCVVNLSDLNTLAKCDGVNWRRTDTGAIIA